MRRKKSNESLSALLDIIGTNAAKAAKAALKEGADGVVEDAKSRCPVKQEPCVTPFMLRLKEMVHTSR